MILELLTLLASCVFWTPALAEDLELLDLKIETNVVDHLANTVVTGDLNVHTKTSRIEFVLPSAAYVDDFWIDLNGKKFQSYVVSSKPSAPPKPSESTELPRPNRQHVPTYSRSNVVRNSNTLCYPIKGGTGYYIFQLKYKEILNLQNKFYRIITNIFPIPWHRSIEVKIKIEESQELTNLEVLPFKCGTSSEIEGKNQYVSIKRPTPSSAEIKFNADENTQKKIASEVGDDSGFQMVVRYDTERDCNWKHFHQAPFYVDWFTGCIQKSIPKHVVFVLDTSGSMIVPGKIDQLKQFMTETLPVMAPLEYFTLVEFGADVKVLTADGEIDANTAPMVASAASSENVKKMQEIVEKIEVRGDTHMYGAIKIALKAMKTFQTKRPQASKRLESVMLMVTDGLATDAEPQMILDFLRDENRGNFSFRISALSLGYGADEGFLTKLATDNHGVFRGLYVGNDTSVQLRSFYTEFSTLLLKNISYSNNNAIFTTKSNFPHHFASSELSIAGKMKSSNVRSSGDILPTIKAIGAEGPVQFTMKNIKPVSSLEYQWALINLQQILEARNSAEDTKKLDQAAKKIAMHYNFVTPVTPLVIRGPDGEQTVVPYNLSKAGNNIEFSVKEEDLNLDALLADKFDMKPRKTGGTVTTYLSTFLLVLSLLLTL